MKHAIEAGRAEVSCCTQRTGSGTGSAARGATRRSPHAIRNAKPATTASRFPQEYLREAVMRSCRYRAVRVIECGFPSGADTSSGTPWNGVDDSGRHACWQVAARAPPRRSPRVPEAAAGKAWMCRSSVPFRRSIEPWTWPPRESARIRQGGGRERWAGVPRTRRVCWAVWPRSPSRHGGCACRCTGRRGSRCRVAGFHAGRATSRLRASPGTPPSAARARHRGGRLPFPTTTGVRPSHHRR